jgi:4-phytase / acid phosphatase
MRSVSGITLIVRGNRLSLAIAFALLATSALPAAPRLKYVVIVSRHGVRSPTWDNARLNQYSAQPWPEWGVAPGELTLHGAALVRLMGAYYREWLTAEHLIDPQGCGDAGRVHIVADTSQRTLETGRAFAQSLMPGCGLSIDSQSEDRKDPLFSGSGTPEPEISLGAVRDRLGSDPQKFLAGHRAALDLLQYILASGRGVPKKLWEPPLEIGVSLSNKTVELAGPLTVSSTLSEDLLLEYANGFERAELGWGRLTRENLLEVLSLHAVYADLMRRTPYLARARGSNLLDHVLLSMTQAAMGKSVQGALGSLGDRLLVLSGHDTNLSNLSGMLGLSWHLPGYQPDDTPPGGALIFSLWHSDAGEDSVTAQYVAQSPDQMRNADRLTKAAPPLSQEVVISGCQAASGSSGCSWSSFKRAIDKAIDPAFVAVH